MTQLLRLMRPWHWSKNLLCLAGVIFSGNAADPSQILRALGTAVAFCAASATIYILNDFLDRNRDREHPRKKDRPLASGQVSLGAATILAGGLALVAGLGGMLLGQGVDACIALYLLLGIAYSIGLKHIVLVDVLTIALGFVLRMVAGIYALDLQPTAWSILCTFFLALVFGFGKRRVELGADDANHRPVLANYTIPHVDNMLNSAATSTAICYALFTVSAGKNPTLILTLPLVWYALWHYVTAVIGHTSGKPELLVWRDRRLVWTAVAWLTLYSAIQYGGFRLLR